MLRSKIGVASSIVDKPDVVLLCDLTPNITWSGQQDYGTGFPQHRENIENLGKWQ